MNERIDTDDRVFLHFDHHVPKLIVTTDKAIGLLDWNGIRLPVVAVDEDLIEYETWHKLLHALMETTCKGNKTRKPYRSKVGSTYGRMIRHGTKAEGHVEINGCLDTPMFDVDAIEVDEDGHVVALVELKHSTERLTRAQRLVIDACRDMGIDYVEDEH